MELRLDGKVALITGASRGIGAAIAASYAAAGAKVMLTSRKQEALEEVAAEIDGETAVFAANAGDLDAGRRCIDATIERFGGLDILVNNAAANPYYGAIAGVDEPRYDKTFQVNLKAPVFWTQHAWQRAFSERPGVVINIASVGGMKVEQGLGVYNLTKAALIHLTNQLALELAPTRVLAIAPGLVKTSFAQVLVDNFGDRLAAQLPTKRLGEPQDIAGLALFLASDAASWMTGETVVIDGGASVKGT